MVIGLALEVGDHQRPGLGSEHLIADGSPPLGPRRLGRQDQAFVDVRPERLSANDRAIVVGVDRELAPVAHGSVAASIDVHRVAPAVGVHVHACDLDVGVLAVGVQSDCPLTEEAFLVLRAFAAHLAIAMSRIAILQKSLKLTQEVISDARFVVAEALAGSVIHSLAHRLDDILRRLSKELKKRTVKQNRALAVSLSAWDKSFRTIEGDCRQALRIVKAAGSGRDFLPSDLHPEVQRTVDMWAGLIKNSSCAVELRFRARESVCRLSSFAFREVLAVLIVNSIQAGANRIAVRSFNVTNTQAPLGNSIRTAFCIEVYDDGQGIARKHRLHLFEPGFSTKKTTAGSGLGLYIARELARQGGGDLVLRRSSRRYGTVFRLTLPIVDRIFWKKGT